MKPPLTLAIDIGSSSVRGALYNGDAEVLADSDVSIHRRVAKASSGAAELDPNKGFRDVVHVIDAVMAKTDGLEAEIEYVASCSFWHSLVGVDQRGKPTTKVLTWADTQSREHSVVLKKRFDEHEVHNRTGAHFHSSFWPAKLLWLRREKPEIWKKTALWLSFSDYVWLKLFGMTTTSLSMASGTGIFDLRKCLWDEHLVRYLKVNPSALPVLPFSKRVTFRLPAAYARRWPRLKNAEWFPTIADGAADNIGSGCVTKHKAALMVGTSGAMRVLYKGEPPAGIPEGLWCYRVDRKRVVVGGALSDGGNLFEWLRRNLVLPTNAEYEIRRRGAAAHGLAFVPLLHGERSTGYDENARAHISGLTSAHDAVDLLQAGMESVAYRFAELCNRLKKVATVREIVTSGGALRASPIWTQIIADVLGRDLTLSSTSEASSRGTVLLALESARIIDSIENFPVPATSTLAHDPECHAVYKRARREHQALYQDLTKITMNAAAKPKTDLDQLCINTIRTLTLDAVQKAESGHPGLPLGMAPAAYVLWTKFLRHNPKNPKWFGRDRFILSGGHGSLLLYCLLHLTGYDLPMDEIKRFRQLHSKTPGHPENILTPGVEVTTGPLGQGFANAVGMGIVSKHLAAVFNRRGFPVVDNYIYCICSDGDLMEGVSSEAQSIAGHLQLGNLIYLYDDNEITIDGSTDLAFTEDRTKRFEAAGWHVQEVADGNDLKAIERAIKEAQRVKDKPSIIRVHTVIGFGLPTQGTQKAHSDAPGEDAVRTAKRNLGWPEDKHFFVPAEVKAKYREAIKNGTAMEREWNAMVKRYEKEHADVGKAFRDIRSADLPKGWEKSLPSFDGTEAKATRAYSGEVINAIADTLPQLLGGSADLKPSNNTYINSSGDFEPGSYQNRNIHYGVREHAMGSAMNGIALFGSMIPYGGTFQTFSDYNRPAIRLAALSHIRVVFVFTHDSIGLGEDGPTHQSVEHLAAMRAIPNLAVIRPADAHETREAWRAAILRDNGPTVLSLSRQKVDLIDRGKYADASGLHKGAYILADGETKNGKAANPRIIIIATGSEIGLAMKTRAEMQSQGTPTRVVSMPCWEFFEAQPQAYQDEVLPPRVTARLVIEAGISMGWSKFVGPKGGYLCVDHFGASAPAADVFKEFGFTVENAVAKAKSLL